MLTIEKLDFEYNSLNKLIHSTYCKVTKISIFYFYEKVMTVARTVDLVKGEGARFLKNFSKFM